MVPWKRSALAREVVEDASLGVDPARASLRVHGPKLDVVFGAVLNGASDGLAGPLAIVGVQPVVEEVDRHLGVGGDPEVLPAPGIPREQPLGRSQWKVPSWEASRARCSRLLATPQGPLGALLLGQVADEPGELRRPGGRDSGDRQLGGELGAVGEERGELDPPGDHRALAGGEVGRQPAQ